MTSSQKPTIWILDDQWRSALTKISWFFSFTEAAFPAPNSPEALKALDASVEAAGWRLARLAPGDLDDTRLHNGIALIDINWSAAPSSEPGLVGLSPSEKEHYGITLAEEILARRKPYDNLELILFSHTKGSRLTAYYVDLMKRGVERVHPVVILDESSDGPLIRTYGWEACRRVTGQLLQQIPGTTRKTIADNIEAKLEEADFVQPEDFTAGIAKLEADGIAIRDLAVPFYQRSEAEEARAAPEEASQAGLQPLRDWNALVQSQRIAFDLPEDLANQPTALIRALLRYRKIDHLDGFLFLMDIASSRYADPIGKLTKTIRDSKGSLKTSTLYDGFKRIVSVALGTPIRKLADGMPFDALKSSPFQNLPRLFHDRSLFDVEGGTHTPEAKLSIFDSGETGYRIKVDPSIIWENPLILAGEGLETFRASAPASPEPLFELLEQDPGNLQIVLECARRKDALLAAVPQEDPRWELVRAAAQEQVSILKRASKALESYAEFVAEQVDRFDSSEQKAFAKDLRDSNPRCRLWDSWRDEIETLLDGLDASETLGSRLASILEITDTPEGEAALESLLSTHFPRARAYARETVKNRLIRSGLFTPERLKSVDAGFAKLFPSGNPEASRRTWIATAIAALGPCKDDLCALADQRLEKKLAPLLGTELVQKVAGLEGYDFLERSDGLTDENLMVEGSNGLYTMRAEKDDS